MAIRTRDRKSWMEGTVKASPGIHPEQDMDRFCHMGRTIGDHEAHAEADAGRVDHTDDDADGGTGGADGQGILHGRHECCRRG